MRFVRVILLTLIMSFSATAYGSAHGSGTVLSNTVDQDYIVNFEYETLEIIKGEGIPLAIEVLKEQEAQEIEAVVLRISNDLSQVNWSGTIIPEELIPRTVRLLASFPESGTYNINLRIKLKNREQQLRTEFSVKAEPSRKGFLEEWGGHLVAILSGLLIGAVGGALIWRRKSI